MIALSHLVTKSPIGALHVIHDNQIILAAGFSDRESLRQKLALTDQERAVKKGSDSQWLKVVIERYFDGDISAFDDLEVRQSGNPFSQKAWRAMRKIPAGKVITYSTLASKAGSPAAVRAAGTACGRNAIAPIIPCHRIVRSDGSMGNYGYGVNKKSWLLRHEGAID